MSPGVDESPLRPLLGHGEDLALITQLLAAPPDSVRFTVYSVQCTVYSVQCTVYSVQCIVYIVQLFSPWFTLSLYGVLYCAVFSYQSTPLSS